MNPPNPDTPATLTPIPALSDNYIWMVQKNHHAIIVDPGDPAPVLAHLGSGITLEAILVTHHHQDHVGGVLALHQRTGARVYGPRHEKIPHCDIPVGQGDRITLPGSGLQFDVLDVPGHTAGHVAYAGQLDADQTVVFCGDTLFAAGCGRLFEGTPAQMLQSLGKIGHLPPDTLVCCAHEYTAANIRWALQVDPDNAMLQARARDTARLRAQGLPTVPSRLALEHQTNPFLRTSHPAIMAAASQHDGTMLDTPQAVFASLRAWKNKA
ncbi:hydroxyacylglutathione hydrolase [Castellaniella sp.]|uniref:hydroxyacylglutathione hydrolase n=1 Tax=Castellaniella sp. TaxID=1955812 RepID=UPI002AFF9EE0|nr:hydroxyacylglutathione hydrolase [Castellaniella sp.]